MKLRNSPFVLAYAGVLPTLSGPVRRSEPGSAILGRVTLGSQAVLERFAVLRADGHVVTVGAQLHLGLRSTVHIAHEVYGATLGERVSVGANSVVHACTVGDDCVIQDWVSVLDGSTVGDGCVIARGSVVYPRHQLPAGQWCEGSPAKAIRPVDAVELRELHEALRANSRDDAKLALLPAHGAITIRADARDFVAATVTGKGEIGMGERSSLWFGCVVDAAEHGVSIGAGTNVQDNTILRSTRQRVTIGAQCTIGHNVLLHDCVIGDRVLVGMGSMLAPGTIVQNDVLIAAGSTTEPGQVLESGWMWAGRPARQVTRLNERTGQMAQQAAVIYCDYAVEFAGNQADELRPAVE